MSDILEFIGRLEEERDELEAEAMMHESERDELIKQAEAKDAKAIEVWTLRQKFIEAIDALKVLPAAIAPEGQLVTPKEYPAMSYTQLYDHVKNEHVGADDELSTVQRCSLAQLIAWHQNDHHRFPAISLHHTHWKAS